MVQNAEVLEHLARELHSLRQGLAESGLTLGEEGIVLFHQEQHGEGHQHAGGDTSGESDSALESADENESEFEDGNWIAADKLVDVNV
jgi:flagellar hook-length control protein FliK